MQLSVSRGDRFDMIGDKVCAAASATRFLGSSVLLFSGTEIDPQKVKRFLELSQSATDTLEVEGVSHRRRGHFAVRSHFQGLVIDVVQHALPATPKAVFSGDARWQDTF